METLAIDDAAGVATQAPSQNAWPPGTWAVLEPVQNSTGGFLAAKPICKGAFRAPARRSGMRDARG